MAHQALPSLLLILPLLAAARITPSIPPIRNVVWIPVLQAPSGANECPFTCASNGMQHVSSGLNLPPDSSDPQLALCGSTKGFYAGFMMAGEADM